MIDKTEPTKFILDACCDDNGYIMCDCCDGKGWVYKPTIKRKKELSEVF